MKNNQKDKNKILLYHGSSKIIVKPQYGEGKPYNDYGLAFYCTREYEIAKEWGCAENRNGICNCYEFRIDGLSELNLVNGQYNILNWLAILLENRTFMCESGVAKTSKDYLLKEFLPDYKRYDYIVGYRADDSYFSFAKSFLQNTISLQQLEKAMFLGKLGLQWAIRSEAAFSNITFVKAEMVNKDIYYARKTNRDQSAREAFVKEQLDVKKGIYMIDILREKWRNEDERLQSIIC